MPALHEAWRIVRRFFVPASIPAAAGRQTGTTDDHLSEYARAGSGRLHGIYERVREQVLETQRSNELAMQAEMRKVHRAKRRALLLLMKQLNPEQRQEFRKCGYFHVVGGSTGNRYRIRVAAFANIDLLGPNGRVKHRLCAHPAGDVPVYDVMAAQLLHLQDPATEMRFLQRANIHPALSEDRIRSNSAWVI